MQSPYVLFVLIAAPRARGNERIERGLVQGPANSESMTMPLVLLNDMTGPPSG